MNTQSTPRYGIMVTSLRRRARSLRRQALWMQQAFLDGRARRITADVVHEVVALREESRQLDKLATRYERRLRQTQSVTA